MSEHTDVTWIAVGAWVEVEDDDIADICTCATSALDQQHLGRSYQEECANARRIAACVNACQHISTESLESGLQQNLLMRARIAEEQRNELLAAAKEYASHYLLDEKDDPSLCFDDQQHKLIVALFDAISKAEAGQ